MHDNTTTWCVFGALGLELKGIARRLESPAPHASLPDCRTGSLGETTVHLVRTGVGRNAARAVDKALRALEPAFAVCLGTAGALTPALKVGDLVAAREVLLDGQPSRPCDPALVEEATKAGAREGACLTVARPLCLPEDKKQAGAAHRAHVCDMEAWHASGPALQRAVPFLALKAVSDGVKDALPDAARFTGPDGAVDGKKLARHLASRPDEAARALRFRRNAGLASAKLADVFCRMAETNESGMQGFKD